MRRESGINIPMEGCWLIRYATAFAIVCISQSTTRGRALAINLFVRAHFRRVGEEVEEFAWGVVAGLELCSQASLSCFVAIEGSSNYVGQNGLSRQGASPSRPSPQRWPPMCSSHTGVNEKLAHRSSGVEGTELGALMQAHAAVSSVSDATRLRPHSVRSRFEQLFVFRAGLADAIAALWAHAERIRRTFHSNGMREARWISEH